MRILLLNTYRVVNAKGGTEKVFCDMANAMAEKGHEVFAVCLDENQGLPGFQLDERVIFLNAHQRNLPLSLQPLSIKLRSLRLTHKERTEARDYLFDLATSHKIRKTLPPAPLDIAVAFQPESCQLLRIIYRREIPIATMLHNAPNIFFHSRTPKKLITSTESSDAIQVLQPEYKEELTKIFPNTRIIYIPNAVTQNNETSEANNFKIVNIGRACSQKQQDLLIKAFSLLKTEFPEWEIEIWGETHTDLEFTNQLKAQIAALGLDDRISLCGVTNDVKEKLLTASIFAFPSKFEGFPLALTEAMSYGLPSVGCKECPGVNTLIRDGENGFLCDGTPESLAEALRKLMRDQDLRLRLGAQAKEDMKEFTPERVWDQWEDLLTELVEKHRER